MTKLRHLLFALATAGTLPTPCALAATVGPVDFVHGLALPADLLDASAGTAVERRLGFFSDLTWDRASASWWGLSDRGPGGGVLDYPTRVQRFTLDIGGEGAISNFRVAETVQFRNGAQPFNGRAPNPPHMLGQAFDPEGFAIRPDNGHFLVSDEYGPSLLEFDRSGQLVRRLETPAGLIPRGADGTPNFAGDAGNVAGKRSNRGFEGLTISPDGRHAFAALQSALLDEGGADGRMVRIVRFDLASGRADGQFAYAMDTAARGRGISALVALDADTLLVLERNNRGIGVDATLAGAQKLVWQVDLRGATDVSAVSLPADPAALPAGVRALRKVRTVLDLGADTLAALGHKVPEKWEGLAIGPQLADGRWLMLAGTDNDYSVTQTGSGTQYDVWMRLDAADPRASAVLCPIGSTVACDGTLTAAHQLLPGVLHAYAVQLEGYVPAGEVPEPAALALALAGLAAAGAARRRG